MRELMVKTRDVIEEEAHMREPVGEPYPLAMTRMVGQRPRRALGRRQAKRYGKDLLPSPVLEKYAKDHVSGTASVRGWRSPDNRDVKS